MPDFDVEAFVTKLDSMGMKLTAVPLADGKLRINRWRTLNACENTQQIQNLWATQIGNNQDRIDVLAAHLAEVAPRTTAYSISPNRMQIAPQSKALPGPAIDPSYTAPDVPRPATSQSDSTPQKPQIPQTPLVAQSPRGVPTAASQQVAAQRGAEKAADVSSLTGVGIRPE